MNITSAALKHIRLLQTRQRVIRGTGLRLGLKDTNVYLRWDRNGPKEYDLVLIKQGMPILIDSYTYLRLTDYALDFVSNKGLGRLVLRPRRQGETRISIAKPPIERRLKRGNKP